MKITVVESGIKKGINQASQKASPMQYGVWGVVTDVNAKTACVDVRLSSGVILKEVPVACMNEWVCEYKDVGYVSGARNLPPEHARVFLLMPTGSFESAFVLCSGLSRYEKAHEKAFMAASDSERTEKNTVRETCLPGKWKSRYDYQTGAYHLASPSEKIHLTVHDDNEKQEAALSAFGTDITIDKNGNIKITGHKLATSFDGDVKVDIQGNAEINAKGKVHINGKNLEAARKGDKVKVQIPVASVVIAVAGGSGAPAIGTPNPAPIDCLGEIISGSSSVTIGG
jgi:hypothetical protein